MLRKCHNYDILHGRSSCGNKEGLISQQKRRAAAGKNLKKSFVVLTAGIFLFLSPSIAFGEEPEVIDINAKSLSNIVNEAVVQKEQIDNKNLFNDLSKVSLAAGLSINGETKMYLSSGKECEALLEALKKKYNIDKAYKQTVQFEEKIDITKDLVSPSEIMTVEEALKYIDTNGGQLDSYIVIKGETIKSIAKDHNITVKQLLKLNPELTAKDKLSAGQTIYLLPSQKLINVKVVSRVEVKKEIGFDTEIQTEDNLLAGMSKVSSKGENGVSKIIYELVNLNDQCLSQTVLSEKVIKKPKNEIVVQGTRELAVSGEDSSFIWPYTGSITSQFGMRDGRMHNGIDIAGPEGDAVVAAEAGSVVMASWYNGYGNCIIIDHGGGVTTLYGHLSSYGAAVGQQVGRGEYIGAVGNTGNSTGSHLHFEVQIADMVNDPLIYLP